MATTTASDFVIWTKHIHGDAALVERIGAMDAGETLSLRIEGQVGVWRRMDAGKDGRPTFGIRPIGPAQDQWRELYKTRRGEVLKLEAVDDGGNGGFSEPAAPTFGAALQAGPLVARFVRADAERQAALAALLQGAAQGWRPVAEGLSRDEMHER